VRGPARGLYNPTAMRAPPVFLVLLLAVVGAPSESRAEKVKTNQPTSLLSRPGERGKVLLTVQEGKGMTVLAKDGRWLKVRVSGRTGWVPRSKVDVSDEIVRNTRRRPFVDGRGKDRGFGGEEGPGDRVGADAIGDGVEPTIDEGRGGRGGKGGTGGKGGEVEEEEGGKGGKGGAGKAGKDAGKAGKDAGKDAGKAGKDAGKAGKDAGKAGKDAGKGGEAEEEEDDPDAVVVEEEETSEARPTARVKAKTVALAEPSEDADESFAATPTMVLYPTGNKKGQYTEVENDDGDLGYVPTSSLEVEESGGDLVGGGGGGEGGGPARARQIDARARLGATLLMQRPSTGGGLSSSAATLALGGALTMPMKEKFIVGGELTYDYARAIPGVRNPDGMGTTGISVHNLRLRALGGYDLKKPNGLALFGRLGLHYQSFQIANVTDLTKNKGKIPSEIITAPALGFGVDIPRLTKKIGLHGSLDAVLFSSVKQTKNLEDGANPSARGALFEAGMTYRWKKDLDILATYDLTYFSMSFGAPIATSTRGGMGNFSRGDQFHVFTAGVGKAF
jgi:uncharacterized protein YgiM (DUF1202 family)